MRKLFIFLGLMTLVVTCAAAKEKMNVDPFYESFFEKARLIMSKEEIQIYKHLPDKEAKEKFIVEFWKKRDPTPDTEENEIKAEFEERIAYANRWFNEGKSRSRGWDTARGRILLQLGFPEERHWGEIPDTIGGRLNTTQPYPMEIWVYYRYQMTLRFTGDRQGFGTFRLARVSSQLGTVLALAKRRLDLGSKKPKKDMFKFKADFKNKSLRVAIQPKRVSFAEKEGKMTANFRVEMHVYRNYEKIETIVEKKSVDKDKDELLKTKKIEFSLLYTPPVKGTYFFDVIVTDESSTAKYRIFLKKRVK